MKALGLVVSDRKVFEYYVLKTYLCDPMTYVCYQLERYHSFEVWSKSNEGFQRRRCLSKNVDGRCTTEDDGQRPVTIAHPENFVRR